MAALCHVGERAGIAFGGVARQGRAGSEVALAVSQKDPGCQLPVPAFDQDDVRVAIAVQVANTGVRRGFGHRLQGDDFEIRYGCVAEQGKGESRGCGESRETLSYTRHESMLL
jgi:hypothetical protein